MRTYTNLAWPDDPYRTGQQLYRRPAPRLTALTALPPARGSRYVPAAVATVYLPLHRTRTVTVTEQTLVFGFRAATVGRAGAAALAAVADLDLMQARRHAAVLAGHMLDGDLAALRRAAGGPDLRGLTAVARDWADRHAPRQGTAAMFDCLLDLPGQSALAQACQQAGIAADLGSSVEQELEPPASSHALAAMAVERALVIALVCARHLGRYQWDAPLRTGRVMAAAAWDCFPGLPAAGPAALACGATQMSESAQRPGVPAGAASDRHQ